MGIHAYRVEVVQEGNGTLQGGTTGTRTSRLRRWVERQRTLCRLGKIPNYRCGNSLRTPEDARRLQNVTVRILSE